MKKARGFLAEDGMFFEDEYAAIKHDNEMIIRAYCVTHTPNPLDADRFLEYIEALAEPIKGYIDAASKIKANSSIASEASQHQANATEQERLSSILKQPPS